MTKVNIVIIHFVWYRSIVVCDREARRRLSCRQFFDCFVLVLINGVLFNLALNNVCFDPVSRGVNFSIVTANAIV